MGIEFDKKDHSEINDCFGLYKSAAFRSFWILTEDMWGARKDPGKIDRPTANYEVVTTVNSTWRKIAKKVHFFRPGGVLYLRKDIVFKKGSFI